MIGQNCVASCVVLTIATSCKSNKPQVPREVATYIYLILHIITFRCCVIDRVNKTSIHTTSWCHSSQNVPHFTFSCNTQCKPGIVNMLSKVNTCTYAPDIHTHTHMHTHYLLPPLSLSLLCNHHLSISCTTCVVRPSIRQPITGTSINLFPKYFC